MGSKTQYLIKSGFLTSPPKFLETGVQYEVVMGSVAQQHHMRDESALGGKGRVYDLTIYSVVKYFRL